MSFIKIEIKAKIYSINDSYMLINQGIPIKTMIQKI